MSDLDKLFGIDEDLENNGVWVDLGNGTKIKVASAHNQKFLKRYRALIKPFTRKLQLAEKTNTELDKQTQDAVLDANIKAIAETILIDWEGFEVDGKELPYSQENAFDVLKKYRKLRSLVDELSTEEATFKAEELEDNEEKLKKPSTGSSRELTKN